MKDHVTEVLKVGTTIRKEILVDNFTMAAAKETKIDMLLNMLVTITAKRPAFIKVNCLVMARKDFSVVGLISLL